MARTKQLGWLCIVLLAAGRASRAADEVPLTTIIAGTGFERPVLAGAPPGDAARLFVLEQWSGQIRILRDHAIVPTPFLDLGALITVGDDQGARGFAFHPQYAKNGFLFVTYIDRNGDLVLARYQVSSDPDVADPWSAAIVLVIDEPGHNHSGGMIAFSPRDGYLYLATGDGGPGRDPDNRAQDPGSLLGKILRLDVDSQFPYAIPPDNPFVGPGDPLDEIWALGLRHPWRFSFDRLTGDLWLADVGQDAREEVDFQPALSQGGENYGWRCTEGSRCTGLSGCTCGSPELTPPIYDYGRDQGCSVIGGYVYRGCAIPSIQGAYFCSDYCTARILSLRWNGMRLTETRDRTSELEPVGRGPIQVPFSFGEDAFGELYVLDGATGTVWKIVPRDVASHWSTYGTGWPGTLGVPRIGSQQPPIPCHTIGIEIENSRGQPTRGHLLFGLSTSSTPSSWDGTFLVAPTLVRTMLVPSPRAVLRLPIPCDVSVCQASGYFQILEEDPGASKGYSFSAGLRLLIVDN
ncbi:MAG: PQQ-dependent sugar dehydrogenase [Planctomycetota bacterium]